MRHQYTVHLVPPGRRWARCVVPIEIVSNISWYRYQLLNRVVIYPRHFSFSLFVLVLLRLCPVENSAKNKNKNVYCSRANIYVERKTNSFFIFLFACCQICFLFAANIERKTIFSEFNRGKNRIRFLKNDVLSVEAGKRSQLITGIVELNASKRGIYDRYVCLCACTCYQCTGTVQLR